MGVVVAILMVAGGCQTFTKDASGRPDSAANPACSRVAAQRAQDAGYNGQSAEIQRATYDAAYKGCLGDLGPSR